MLLDVTHERLGWPSRQTVLDPPGVGAQVYLQLAREKLGQAIAKFPDAGNVEIGILASDLASSTTEAPLAIVCEFSTKPSSSTLRELHKLAWNFCRSPLLLIVEPHQVRAWTCCEPPPEAADEETKNPEVAQIDLDPNQLQLSEQVAESLHWVHIVSGQFLRTNEKRFQRANCADESLLENLEFVREELHRRGRLDYDTIHDLLARLIFVQFLFQRKDSSGKAALDETFLASLHSRGVLSKRYLDIAGVLTDHNDTYMLFRLLNSRFNGDLFPGEGLTEDERESEWQTEMQHVKQKHLDLLSEFVSGAMKMKRGERNLWPLYSFDIIPLEFISSVYEVFVGESARETGAHYTPSHIVDFILDSVLPWDSKDWDIKILDPACGSGIFLVKAYQRLIHRWKQANVDQLPDVSLLRQLLERNLFGIDINPHAIRVASFSLYLAMCDAIDPRHYWQKVKFPRLRGKRLVRSDFFNDTIANFQTYANKGTYDLIIGNAPWGKNTIKSDAKAWQRLHPSWKVTYGSVGPLFLAKSLWLVKQTGRIAMLQPAALLFNSSVAAARDFRNELFLKSTVRDVINLSALRFGLFQKAISPSCILILSPEPSTQEPFWYKCPKPVISAEDDFRLVIEPHDVHEISPLEAATDPLIWTALMWGGRRDLRLIKRLMRRPSISTAVSQGLVKRRQGLNRGNRQREDFEVKGRRILEGDQLPSGSFLRLDAERLPVNVDPFVDQDAASDYSAFSRPQLIVKQGWQIELGRFQAALIEWSTGKTNGLGILCSKSYVSISALNDAGRDILEAACLGYNSRIAVYYLLLTSGRLASYRPEVNVDDLVRVPLPEPRTGILDGLKTLEDVDQRAIQSFQLKRSEKALVDDLIKYTLPDFKGDSSSPGRQSTRYAATGAEIGTLEQYCSEILTVLKAGFGSGKAVSATIFCESVALLPVRLVSISFDWPGRDSVVLEQVESPTLLERLNELNRKFLDGSLLGRGGFYYQRVARIYSPVEHLGRSIPSVFLIKPDRIRYWTRSAAQRDADSIGADMIMAVENSTLTAVVGASA